ncbi:MAG: PEP-CTERM sorting domain-containing protein [Gemmatimonadota bacterium]
MRSAFKKVLLGMASAGVVGVATPAPAGAIVPCPAGQVSTVIVCGGNAGGPANVFLTVLGGHAAYFQEMYFIGTTTNYLITPTKPYGYQIWNAGNPVANRINLGALTGQQFTFGDQLVFLLKNTAGTFLSTNVSNVGYLWAWGNNVAVPTDIGYSGFVPNTPFPYGTTYGWDDSGAGPDQDNNDFVFAVETVAPEPVSMTLLATGLAGVAGVGLRRRKKAEQAKA